MIEPKVKTPEEVAREVQLRQILLNSAKQKCAPLEQNIRASMNQKYPNGMTAKNLATEMKSNFDNGFLTMNLQSVDLSNTQALEKAIVENNTDLSNVLLIVANEAQNPYVAAQSLELYLQMERFNEREREIAFFEHKEEVLEMREEADEIRMEMDAAIQEDKDELKAEIQEDKDELMAAIKDEREHQKTPKQEKEEKKLFGGKIKSPRKLAKEALGLDTER